MRIIDITPTLRVIPHCQPRTGDLFTLGQATAIVNLRGHRTPAYEIPDGTRYIPYFIRGGPTSKFSPVEIEHALAAVPKDGVVLIHCEHELDGCTGPDFDPED